MSNDNRCKSKWIGVEPFRTAQPEGLVETFKGDPKKLPLSLRNKTPSRSGPAMKVEMAVLCKVTRILGPSNGNSTSLGTAEASKLEDLYRYRKSVAHNSAFRAWNACKYSSMQNVLQYKASTSEMYKK